MTDRAFPGWHTTWFSTGQPGNKSPGRNCERRSKMSSLRNRRWILVLPLLLVGTSHAVAQDELSPEEIEVTEEAPPEPLPTPEPEIEAQDAETLAGEEE